MEDGPSQRKTARLENDPGSCCSSAGQRFDLFPWRNSEKGSDYLTRVSDDVSMYRHKTLDLENPPGATLTIGDLDDTIYSEEEDEVNGWGKFYLPDIVSMQVVGVVEGTSCPSDQLVLMTCEDRKVYAYDGEKLHLVASSLRQLHYKGIKYPAPERYYKGEAFKHKTEEDWANVRKRLDQKYHELVMLNKSEFLQNLKLLKQNKESQGICMSSDCGRKPNNHHTEHANSTQNGPKLGSNPEPFYNVEIYRQSKQPQKRCNRAARPQNCRNRFGKNVPRKSNRSQGQKREKRGTCRMTLCITAVTTKQLRLWPTSCRRNSHLVRAGGRRRSRTGTSSGSNRRHIVHRSAITLRPLTGEVKTSEPATWSDPRLIDARGERRLARVFRSNRRATVAHITEKVNAGSDRKVSEHTVHRSVMRMGLRSRRPVRVPMVS